MLRFIGLLLAIVVSAQAGLIGDWCGTIKALEQYRNGETRVRPTLSGPVENIDRPMFRVHYTRSGIDRVSQTYAESTASALSFIWAKMIDTLGWVAPAPDYNQGGDNRFDCYITSLPSGIAGVCYSENSYANPYPDGSCAHIRISNTLDLASGVKIVTCHEFNHASQMRYSAQEQSWWYENTATWIEDLIYDNINDYVHYLTAGPNPFANPDLPITTFSGFYQYAGCVWPMFLNDYYDSDCPRQIWHYQGMISGQNTLSGINYVLTNYYGSSLSTALEKYALWRYFTNYRADTVNYFKEGHLYPLVRAQYIVTTYPNSATAQTLKPSGPGGCNYVQLLNGGGKLFASFNGQTGYQWKCFLAGYGNNQNVVYNLNLDGQMQASDSCAWQNYDQFAIIPVITQWQGSANNIGYSYTADLRLLHDVGIVSLSGFPSYTDSGVIINPVAIVKNYGLNYESFPVKLTVGNFYSNTHNFNLNSGDSVIIHFASCTLKARGYITYACSVYSSIDEREFNNNYGDQVFIRVKDVGVVAVTSPVGNVSQGMMIQPSVWLRNYGNLRETFDVEFRIGDWSATQRFGLNGGLEFEFVFDSIWHASSPGNYAVKCTTKLADDVNTDNDYLICSCNVLSSAVYEESAVVRLMPAVRFSPNQISISGIETGKLIRLDIYDALGNKVYSVSAREQVFNLNRKLASGCYFIQIKSDNHTYQYKKILLD